MKNLCRSLAILTVLAAPALAQSGPVNVDEVFTIRSVYGGGQHLLLSPDKKGNTYTADLTSSTQILSKNRPLAANRLQAGWRVEIRGGHTTRRHLRAEVIVVKGR